MNNFQTSLHFFLEIFIQLTILFVGITAFVSLTLKYLPETKIREWMKNKGILGNIIGVLIGALTPFCACSTIPMTVGFFKTGIPFTVIMSFYIASPLLNPIVMGMLFSLLGWKIGLIYFIVVFIGAVFFGILLDKLNFSNYVKNVKIKNSSNSEKINNKNFFLNLKDSLITGIIDYKNMVIYLFVGVLIGSIIYGYIPEEFIMNVSGEDNLIAVPISAVIGVPLFLRAESAIAIGLALMEKGMSVGAVIALLIGGAGMAVPEMSMLGGIFKKKLIIAIVFTVFFTAVIGGYFFNLVF